MPGWENYGFESGKLVNPHHIPRFLELSENFPENAVPLLDQETTHLKGITGDQQHWRDHGYLIKRHFIPDYLIDEYLYIRDQLKLEAGEFPNITPYLNYSVIRDICCSKKLHYLLVDLLGEELGLHFILTSFKSTERGWHQDDYLNPENTMARYAAVWMAMGDIHPDSGPFEFVTGSHKWPCLRREKVQALVKPEEVSNQNHDWAVIAEYLVNKAVDQQIRDTGAEVVPFYAKKGDILIWHGKLMHRGSIMKNSNLLRPALICHYSNIRDRRDLGSEITRHGDGGYFWEFSGLGRMLSEDAQDSDPGLTTNGNPGNAAALIERDALQETYEDGFVENFFARDLERFVKDEAFHFGDNAAEWYFEPAEATMNLQWKYVQSFLSKRPIDYTNTMELSCGRGRNSESLSTLSKNLVLVDVVPENILFCKNRFPDKPWRFVVNNGFDLREISSKSITFVYCFEAAVHFDLEIILSYIKEFRRVMTPGALGFVHHSNVTANPGKDYRTIPHGRNFMSKEIFAHLCVHNGLEIVDQHVFDQGGPEADCFSLFRKIERTLSA